MAMNFIIIFKYVYNLLRLKRNDKVEKNNSPQDVLSFKVATYKEIFIK
jgi:hypothetical protein